MSRRYEYNDDWEGVLSRSSNKKCSCYRCWWESTPTGEDVFRSRMFLCEQCGNKRCPHASDHRLDCSGTNDLEQMEWSPSDEDRVNKVMKEALKNMTSEKYKKETVNHPVHYNMGSIEVIDFIEAWEMGFHEGNVVKYVARAKHKGKQVEDLKKARWYLDRLIEKLENKK